MADVYRKPTWSWHQFPSTWTPYDDATSLRLEEAFSSGRGSAVEVTLGPSRTRYHLDLLAMQQVNVATQFQRTMRREPTASMQGSSVWFWDGGHGWVAYDEQPSQQLEVAHRAGRLRTALMLQDTLYDVDLQKMEQVNARTRFGRKIARAAPGQTPALAGAKRPRRGPHALAVPALAPQVHAGLPAALAPAVHARTRHPASAEVVTFTSHDGAVDVASFADWRLLRADEYDPEADCPIMCCPYGEDPVDPVVKLSCGCIFNKSTAERALIAKPQCPLCHFKFALPGAQPTGAMAMWRVDDHCEGNEDVGTIVIQYSFASGVQGPQHPEPGKPYAGTDRVCYLPDTGEGRKTLELLKQAFLRGISFKIGTSVTTGRSNVVTWAIHHKTSMTGGTRCYGYPDPGYFGRCAAECAALGLLVEEQDGAPASAPAAGGE